MKRCRYVLVIMLLVSVLALSLAGCNGASKELSNVPKVAVRDSMDTTVLNALTEGVSRFGSRLVEGLYSESTRDTNIAVSPISVYMALAMVAECEDDSMRANILDILGVDYDTLSSGITPLYEMLTREDRDDLGKLRTALDITNSIWLDESVTFKADCIDSLANDYYCHSYKTAFARDNKGANRAIRKAVKKSTKGLIDNKYQFDPLTYFVIINTIYLKDVWNSEGDDLELSSSPYTFHGIGGDVEERFLIGEYLQGRAIEGESYTSFYMSTYKGYKLKMLLPRDGYTLDNVMDSVVMDSVNGVRDYGAVDEDAKTKYYTRCIFPEFSSSYDGSLDEILAKNFGFESHSALPRLLDAPLNNGTSIYHSAQLEVNRRGIEGASMTVFPGCGAPGPDGYEHIYADFVVDRPFGYILTSPEDIPLFAGVVNNI